MECEPAKCVPLQTTIVKVEAMENWSSRLDEKLDSLAKSVDRRFNSFNVLQYSLLAAVIADLLTRLLGVK